MSTPFMMIRRSATVTGFAFGGAPVANSPASAQKTSKMPPSLFLEGEQRRGRIACCPFSLPNVFARKQIWYAGPAQCARSKAMEVEK